ncbi:hypothetical protein GALL_314490 [mine drainage metagenome]|uniref:Porin domain-containing protein n=1 Tax=mine drainage metagenome TaxID=410659 RepID=A0A1J5QSU2_9ZZZZ
MNKTMKMAVAAALAMGASAAQAGIIIPAGDWNIDIGGNVNAYYTHTNYSGALQSTTPGALSSKSSNNVQTGLLPSALGIGGKTRQNDMDVAFQFTFFVGDGSNSAGSNNSINIRQAYGSFGDKSWGTIKFGRDLGVFGSDAILSDMTLLGVGVGAGSAGSSTLGRIGSGYMYADWVGQFQYASPNWNGFSFVGAVRQPWTNSVDNTNHEMGFDGKVSYEWAGDFAGKVWLGGITEKQTAVGAATGYTGKMGEIGGKVGYSGAELVGYYYTGSGMSGAQNASNFNLNGLMNLNQPVDHDQSGGYIQGTFKIPGVGTKLGVSWGESIVSANAGQTADFKDESWIIGAYHPLTKSVNLVAEYTDNKIDGLGNSNAAGTSGKARTVSLGAIMFF